MGDCVVLYTINLYSGLGVISKPAVPLMIARTRYLTDSRDFADNEVTSWVRALGHPWDWRMVHSLTAFHKAYR